MRSGLPSAALRLPLSDSSPMLIKCSIQKAEAKHSKQSRDHEDHRRRFMPPSYVGRDLHASKGLKRQSRTDSLKKIIATAWKQKCYCIGVPEALECSLLPKVSNNCLMSQHWYEQRLTLSWCYVWLINETIFNRSLVYAEKMALKINLFSEKGQKVEVQLLMLQF